MTTPNSPSSRPLSVLFREFTDSEQASGIVLLGATLLALLWVNSPWGASYEHVWHTTLGGQWGGG